MRALGTVVVLAMVLLGVALAQSQTAPPPPPKAEHKALAPGDIQWGEPPPVFNQGADFAVMYGDPSKAGDIFIVRLRLPAGYKIMPHWHPTDENVTVLSGSFAMGMGDHFDANVKPLPVGSFFSMPAHMHHFAVARADTVVEVSAMGPFKLIYVNPEDDPSKRRAKR